MHSWRATLLKPHKNMNLNKIKNNKYLILVIVFFVVIVMGVSLKVDLLFDQGESIKLSLFDRFFGKELSSDAIEIVLSKDKYKVGEEIFFAIQNKTDKEVVIENECPNEPLEVYYLDGKVWRHLKGEANKSCSEDDKEIVIGPHELKGSSFLPWQNVIFNKPGRYKIELEIIGHKNKHEQELEITE